MVSLFRFLLVSLVFTLGTTSTGHAASFDCNKATTETEIAICDSPELSALDERMSGVYVRGRQVTKNVSGSNLEIQTDQIDWLNKRNQCGAETSCLLNAYQTRIEELKEFDFENLFKLSELEKQMCKDQAEQGFDSGSTQKMLDAGNEYNRCLEKIIINLIVSTTTADKQSVTSSFKDLQRSYGSLVYHIFNSLKECSPLCGLMYQLYPSSSYDGILTELLLSIRSATTTIDTVIIPKADEILMSFPICNFKSSLGPRCKTFDANKKQSVRIFTNQMVQKITLGSTAAEIETDDWYYTISEVEKNIDGFSFSLTDDGKSTSYLSSTKYFATFDPVSQKWQVIGEKLTYLSGPDQQNVGEYIRRDIPIILNTN
jgi:uncharacterized protein